MSEQGKRKVTVLMREQGLLNLVRGLELYVKSHESLFASPISSDPFSADVAMRLSEGIISALNTESGRLDCGQLFSRVTGALKKGGLA